MKKHPYTKISYWKNPDNWFWEKTKNNMWSEKAKEYYRNWLANMLNVGPGLAHKLENDL